ncbi:MAG: nucleotidyltransferase domain-containing protein [Candidatus Zambryskibacteria bacterium]|nr:nucleotidyltransferase domain-containing protein [Candidatus Zambryskibacteria bacterium]
MRKTLLKKIIREYFKNKVIKKELLFVSLLGSFQTGEAINSYSDLDILLILKSDKFGVVKNPILYRLKDLSKNISKKYNIEISLLTHTIFDFEQYVDFNYLIHYSWGDVLFGSKASYQKLFTNIINKKYSAKFRKDLMYYNLVHARFNLIRQYVSWNKFNKANYEIVILKLIIDKIIEICDWALVYKNIFKKTKKEVLDEFNKKYDLEKYGHIPEQAYSIRSNWNPNDLNKKEINVFIDESILFVQELVKIIYRDYVKN